jgi:hypothetical protein
METTQLKTNNFDLNVIAIIIFLMICYVSNAQVGIGTTSPLSNFEVNGSNGQTVTIVTTNLTLDASHSIVICNNGVTARTITLPTAVGIKGRIYTIKRGEASTANVTVATTASQMIDGEMDYMLMNAKESVTVISDGADWKTTGTFVPQFPMGEISYFDLTGQTINITSSTTDGNSNMFLCNPASTFSTDSCGFSNGGANTGRLKYTGTTTRSFHIACTISVAPTSSGTFIFELKKSGTTYLLNSRVIQKLPSSDTQSTAMHVFVTLAPNDYLELWVGNTTGTGDIKIKSLNLFALGM